ncbi:MAG: hypothetical protein GTO63_06250 [Anaerolineae bacterium]|nr:hypothetical protein [Anaerolineae bacterium]NIN93604.1 hypothetical protein [Anaerolineae bacterium]NIQ77646.1 hypothetical protein [Anaerolineae bacterium]
MAENLYYQDGGGGGMLTSLLLPFAAWQGNRWALRSMLGRNAMALRWGSGASRGIKGRLRAQAGAASKAAWSNLLGGGKSTWDFAGGFARAREDVGEALGLGRAGTLTGGVGDERFIGQPKATIAGRRAPVRTVKGVDVGHAGSATRINATFKTPGGPAKTVAVRAPSALVQGTAAGRAAVKAGAMRTVGALAAPVTGVASAYFTWGWLMPLAAEAAIGGFSELARVGRELRMGRPETSVGFRDMATRERAFTMRQASAMAIHTSQSGVRAALGSEASFLHA